MAVAVTHVAAVEEDRIVEDRTAVAVGDAVFVGIVGRERGLLGLAFPPGFAAKQYFYVDYTDANRPAGYAAQLTLTGNEGPDTFGTGYTGYTEGDQVTIGEVEPITMPQECTNTASGDLGQETLSGGLNEFSITNTVECAALTDAANRLATLLRTAAPTSAAGVKPSS